MSHRCHLPNFCSRRLYVFSDHLIGLFCCILVVALVFFSASVASAAVQARGMASLQGASEADARTSALNDAMRKAVEQAIGAMLTSETLVENYVVIQDKILTKVQGYVKNYKILSEGRSGTDYEVVIDAEVEEMALADDVAALAHVLPRMNYPTMVVTVAQKAMTSEMGSVQLDVGAAEQTVVQILSEKGFRIAEPSALEAERLRQVALAAQTNAGSLAQAREAASHLAQLMVACQLVMQDNGPAPYNPRIHSYGAFLTAKLYETGTGRMLATASADANVPNISFAQGALKASQEAAKKLANDLSSKVVKVWLDACYNEHEVSLIVENISFDELASLQAGLSGLRGVSRVNKKGFLQNRAELLIGWKDCNTQRLAELLSTSMSALKIIEVQGNTIRASYGMKTATTSRKGR